MPGPVHTAGLIGLALALASTAAGAAQSVHIDVTETSDGGMAIVGSATAIHAGETTFDVTNKSDSTLHEFLIARLDTAPDQVPFNETTATIKESALTDVTELGDLEPGSSSSMTMNLAEGQYLLFCNLPGHFKSGMYEVLTMTK